MKNLPSVSSLFKIHDIKEFFGIWFNSFVFVVVLIVFPHLITVLPEKVNSVAWILDHAVL